MDFAYDNDLGFSESYIHFARRTFFRDCPDGRCTKRKFLTYIRKSHFEKSKQANIFIIKILQNYRYKKKFFSMMFDIYDLNQDGILDFDEYIYALSALTGANLLRTTEMLFSFFDINKQGYITREEFNSRKKMAAKSLGSYKPNMKNNLLLEQAFNTMDADQDGCISKEEFIQWYIRDSEILHNEKPTNKRKRVVKSLSSLFDSQNQMKAPRRQQQQDKYPVDSRLKATTKINDKQRLVSTNRIDQHLSKIFHQAQDHFRFTNKIQPNDNQSSSNGSHINDKNCCQSILNKDTYEDLLYQPSDAAIMEALPELRQHRYEKNLTKTCLNLSNEAILSFRL